MTKPNDDKDLTPATIDRSPVPMLHLVADDDEWGDVGVIDLAPPAAVRIPHVPVNRKLDGGIIDPTTGEIGTTMHLILLGRGQSRAQWDHAYSGKDAGPPDCRSFDALVPDANSPDRKAEDCANCPFNRWGEAGDTARCRLSEQWLVFVLDDEGGQYARLRWGGIAASPAARYWESFALRKPRQHPASVITLVTLVPTETDNGTFLAPQFTRAAPLARNDVAPLLADLPMLRAAFAGAVAESVASGDDDAEVVRSTDPGQPDDPFAQEWKGDPIGDAEVMARFAGSTVAAGAGTATTGEEAF